jgi:hypothetical protein
MCSRLEAFGRVTVEAMLCKKPVIGANTGGTLDIVKDGKNGLLYQFGNVSDLKKKIIDLSQNKSKLSILGNNAYEFALKNFTGDMFGKKIHQVLLKSKNNKPNFLAKSMGVISKTLQGVSVKYFENLKNLEERIKTEKMCEDLVISEIEVARLKNNQLLNDIEQIKSNITHLQSIYSPISGSKFFKLWQGYNHLKKLLNV